MAYGVAGAWIAASVGACFQPTFQDGQFQCGPGAQCPPGLRCDLERDVCVNQPTPGADAAVPDGIQETDANPLAGRAAGAMLLYLFDEAQGDTIHDRSGLDPALDLSILYPQAVEWGAGTLAVADENRIWRDTPPERLIRAVQASNELTVEAWIEPAETVVDGPQRILTLSQSSSFQSLMLGQGRYATGEDSGTYVLRMRTSDYPADSDPSPVKSGPNTVTVALTHLVFARDSIGVVRIYINGEQVADEFHTGDFSVWGVDSRHLLGIGNEYDGARQWKGTFHLLALYDRALDPDEIVLNYEVGSDPELQP
jgi:hypothetical protein